jgi:uncharacterized protein (DUF1015 family)
VPASTERGQAWYAGGVPTFEPFAGLRYASDRVRIDDVIAPPYDIISPEERQALEARSPYNSVRLELPRDEPGLDRYRAAARLLAQWRAEGIVARDSVPSFYGYRMTFTDEERRPRQSVGVIGALGLEPPGANGILLHERTTPKAKTDRLQLLRATRANLSPIWGLSLGSGLTDLMAMPETKPLQAVDDDLVTHELWPITDAQRAAAITDAVGSAPVVIADGHHRFETALTYRQERRDAGAGRSGPFDLVMAFIVELVEDQLSVRATHRLINGLPADFDLEGALSKEFDVTPTEPPDVSIGRRMEKAGALALLTANGSWLLVPRHAISRSTSPDDVDSTILEPVLAKLPPHEVTYQHGWDVAAAALAKGAAQAAILLRPATVSQIAETGRGGERMPPKTTFFWPKPRTGQVFREVGG